MDIHSLIETITPLYNKYKQNKEIVSGTDALKIMWDIGDILKKFIEQNDVAPHALFWKIYGRSEGTKNIVKRSYITREFQNRCHRIRKIFVSKKQIEKNLPNLKRFTAFRESMPFFDNKKYQLRGIKKEQLLNLLNSNKNSKIIKWEIRRLQKEKIGITNPRTQRFAEMESGKKIFINFYNHVWQLLKEKPVSIKTKMKQKHIDGDYIISLSKNTNALSQDGLQFVKFKNKKNIMDLLWQGYESLIKEFISQTNAVKIRRFRRIIHPERIVKLADMLDALAERMR